MGWEHAYHPILGVYYIDHNRHVNQLEHPQMEWRNIQASMVNEYLQEANGLRITVLGLF